MSNLLIIGSAGRMGKWFYTYFENFRSNQEELSGSSSKSILLEKIFLVDLEKNHYIDKLKNKKVFVSHEIAKFLKETDIVLFCTPVKETIKIINKYHSLFRQGTILIEISSIKNPIYKRLTRFSQNRSDVIVLCVHPMFGPGALISSPKNIILHVPINKSKIRSELSIIKRLFPRFAISSIDTAEKHDLLVSIMISLIYFINLIFSKLLINISNSNEFKMEKDFLNYLKRVSGSSYKVQSLLSESILTDDVNLFLSLFFNNDKSKQIIKNYGKIYNLALKKLEQNDREYLSELIVKTKNQIRHQIDIDNSYELLYRFLNK